MNLAPHAEIWVDPTGRLTLADIQAQPKTHVFAKANDKVKELSLFLYNLVIFFKSRDRRYLLSRPIVIHADYGLLRIAMLNLIDNACKHSSKTWMIRIGAMLEEDWVGLYVSDQGSGIPEEMQKGIFEPYIRLALDQRRAGVGLGLSFVKRIVELHEGRLSLESAVGTGSTFTIWIKIEIED